MKKKVLALLMSTLLAVTGSFCVTAEAPLEGEAGGEAEEIFQEGELFREESDEGTEEPPAEDALLDSGAPMVGAPGEVINDNVNTESGTGTCGAGLTWTLAEGTLTITGSGAMTDFDNDDSPFDGLNFTSVVIGAGVTSIGNAAFANCTTLKAVNIPATVTRIGKNAFQDCAALQLLILPASVTRIEEGAFRSCTSLSYLNLQGNTAIGEEAFADSGVTNAVIPFVTEIGEEAFRSCARLTKVDAYAAKTVGEWAFAEDTALQSVRLTSTQTLGSYSFFGCTRLSQVTLGKNLKTISYGTFSSCSTLQKIQFEGSQAQWNAVAIQGDNAPVGSAAVTCNVAGVTPIYRLYNPYTGEHFYTPNAGERTHLISIGWNDEGVGWYAPDDGTTLVYRLFHAGTSRHHYTKDKNEIRVLTEQQGWTLEGPVWRTNNKGTPVYRLHNERLRPEARHHYTMDVNEKNTLAAGSDGWVYEGVGWYAAQ